MNEDPGIPPRLDRRELLKGAIAAGIVTAGSQANMRAAERSKADIIGAENAKAGATDWQLTRVRVDGAEGIRSPWVEGYCSHQSVEAGQTIRFMLSANPPAKVLVEVFRMGYYAGRGARLMRTLGPLRIGTQPDPEIGPNRLRECRWEPAVELTVPDDWPSGVYLGRLSRVPEDGVTDPWQSYLVFIVRDGRPADVLFQCSDTTWQAYNRWPGTFSLYDNGGEGWHTGPGVDVSFDRPYGKYRQIYDNPQSVGSGEFLCWEFPLCHWLERHGYDVTYCSNSDLLTPDRGLKCKTFLSVGHDEYWDLRQYESVRRMINEGVSALFLSGNAVNGVTPLRPSGDGRPNRIFTRAGMFGGLAAQGIERGHEFEMTGPDEGLLMGGRNVDPVNGGGDWVVAKPDHWIFEGTGMAKGDRVPGLVGWEFHGAPAEIPGLEVVAEGTALSGGVRPQRWTATVHPARRGTSCSTRRRSSGRRGWIRRRATCCPGLTGRDHTARTSVSSG